MFSLKSKIAIVTGGAKGIGEAACRAFVQQGAMVYLLDIDIVNALRVAQDIGKRCEVLRCDVTDAGAVASTIDQIAHSQGRLDILVNNAGAGHIGKLDAATEEDLDHMYTINVKSIYFCTRAALPYMKKSGGGTLYHLCK